MTMKVLGFENKSFTFDDGRSVNGMYLYLGDESPKVTGMRTERVFMSDGRLAGFVPKVGQNVRIFYNRYGKPDTIEAL